MHCMVQYGTIKFLHTLSPGLLYIIALANLSVFDPSCLGGCGVKPVNLSIEEHIIEGDDVQLTTPLGTQTDTLIPQAERSFQHRGNI